MGGTHTWYVQCRHLDLSSNAIGVVPSLIGSLQFLRTLHMEHNLLQVPGCLLLTLAIRGSQ